MSAKRKTPPLPPPVPKRPPRERGECKTCFHHERAVIELGLAQGRSVSAMAKRFGVSVFSLYRHRRAHMPPAVIERALRGTDSGLLVENLEDLKLSEGERLLSNIVAVRGRLYRLAESAEKVGDYKAATYSYGHILRTLEAAGKMLDGFKGAQQTVINQLIVSGDYLRLRAALINALAPYPEARQAVAKVLRDMEVSNNGSGA